MEAEPAVEVDPGAELPEVGLDDVDSGIDDMSEL